MGMEWRPYRLTGHGIRLERAGEEREAEKRRSEERASIHRGDGIPTIALSQVPVEAMSRGRKEDTEVVWHAAKWPGAGEGKEVRLNGATVNALAKRLKAMEWARARGRGTRQGDVGQRLEQEASLCQ